MKKITILINGVTLALTLGLVAHAPMCVGAEAASGWLPALPGWQYVFPADHACHSDFKTEWWYFTGNLQGDDGRSFGYELTFFRQGVLPPTDKMQQPFVAAAGARSRFVQSDFKFAHFAISDIGGSRFAFTQKTSRGAFGEAGFGPVPESSRTGTRAALGQPLAWIDNWRLQPQADGSWRITAQQPDTSPPIEIDLTVIPTKPPAIEGADGVSQKSSGLGNASHYYSFTRLKTNGWLTFGEAAARYSVHGESWFDHEWASNQLAANQIGWNWFCFQFDDHTELMLYAMRRRDGSMDPASSGTMIRADGETEFLRHNEFELRAIRSWHSKKTAAVYPLEWQVTVPSRGLTLNVQPRLDDQELVVPPISYWEGAIRASGQKAGNPVKAVGNMELTGYAGALKGLQEASKSAADLRSATH